MRGIKEFLYWGIYNKLMRACVHLFYYLPVNKRKIVFQHDFGNGYGDSPKYMAEELHRRGGQYDMVWLVKDKELKFPSFVRSVRLSRLRSVYELATAKVIVTTMKGRSNLKKKKSQFFLYVPHGQIGAKFVERQAGDALGSSYREGSQWHSSVSDLFLSSSKLFTEEVLKWYWYSGEVMECGLPRNDIFFNYTQEDITRIKRKVGLPDNVKVAFYAPTFRDNGNEKAYAIDTKRLLRALEDKTGDKWILLIRLHPCFIWYKQPPFEYSDTVRNVTAYDDMQELLLISDLLISDYSSTMFDFFLMHRPVFLFTTDVEDYQRMRGLKDWFFRVPFPFCSNNDELLQAIKDYDEATYQQRCEEFGEFYGSLEKGTATQMIVDRLELVMK